MTDEAWQATMIEVGRHLGRWEIAEELPAREYTKGKRNPHGGISYPRMFAIKCSVCGTTKAVEATGIRKFMRGRRDPDVVLKCACVVEKKNDAENVSDSETASVAEAAARGTAKSP